MAVGGQDLQGDVTALEQGDLPGVAVVLELHRLLGPGDLAGPAAVGDRCDDRQRRGDGERGAPVGDPVHLLAAAVREDLRVGAAAVEPEHDLRAGPGGFLQLGQRCGSVVLSPDGSPDTKHTARPSWAVTWVSARPLSARPRLLFQPLATGFAPVYGTKWSST